MNWITLDTQKVLDDFPTNLTQPYLTWLTNNPTKAGRLTEITANTVAEFRSAIATDPANILDPDRAKVPENCIRSAEVIIIDTLRAEMGQTLSPADEQAMTRAEIFLRQIGYGHLSIQDESHEPTPSYTTDIQHTERALP